MKIVLQRVKQANVVVDENVIGQIDHGYLLLVGFEREDHEGLLQPMLDKLRNMKLFPDEQGRFGLSLEEVNGKLLIVSQFTLSANFKKGKKPSLSRAMEPKKAEDFYDRFVQLARETEIPVESGEFGASMQVSLQNDGPVTILMESKELFPAL